MLQVPARKTHRLAVVLSLATLLVIGSGGCASSRQSSPDTVSVDLRGADGKGLKIELSSDLVRDIVESALGSELTCDGDLDDELRLLLEAVEARGSRGRAEIRRGDDVLRARRSGQWLRMQLGEINGGALEVKMPWAVASCLMGREATMQDALLHHRGIPVLEVKIKGDNGGRFKLALE
jgi:hypothetical protein